MLLEHAQAVADQLGEEFPDHEIKLTRRPKGQQLAGHDEKQPEYQVAVDLTAPLGRSELTALIAVGTAHELGLEVSPMGGSIVTVTYE